MKVVIIDCGGGNLQSLKNALTYLGIPSEMTSDKQMIQNADLVIFPGQGHFGTVMKQLIERDIRELLFECALSKPFLGICVGMQILFEKSEESPKVSGLNVLPGCVRRFPSSQKIPQMGWNTISSNSQYFYFANSYYCESGDPSLIVATSTYGTTFPSIIQRNQLIGVQFHPEKSGDVGLNFLETIVRNVC